MPYNIVMSHLQIILPFSIPPAAMVPDLLSELQAPAFVRLLALSGRKEIQHFDDFSRLLPHESLLAGHFAPESRTEVTPSASGSARNDTSSPATTHNRMHSFGLTPAEGFWFTLSPVHIHIAQDHLVLTDQRRLNLTEEEARSLFDGAKTMCEETGKTLLYGDAKTWFLRADEWHALQTATPDAACGHNIDVWMAKGEHGLPWRKLQNEIQMLWFIDKVNARREARGDRPVNSVWLHSGSAAIAAIAKTYGASDPIDALIADARRQFQEPVVLQLDSLLAPALNNDWPAWLDAMHGLETTWFAPLLLALKQKKIDQLSLIATDASKLATFALTPRSLWKFWTKPSVDKLFALSHSATPDSL